MLNPAHARHAAVLALLLIAGLAGCTGGPDPSPTTTPTPTPPAPPTPPDFDGQAAWDFTFAMLHDADGTPRFRIPGTPDHDAVAAWLMDAMQVDGWRTEWQNVTGAEYLAMEKGSVSWYADPDGACRPDDHARVEGLAFSNLIAHFPDRSDPLGTSTGPDPPLVRLVLAAHWDSLRYARNDPDGARKMDPMPGANDGAAGVGLLLQMMREVPDLPHLSFDLTIVFFDGEDGFADCHPLAGSIAFVQQQRARQTDRVLLLDMIGDPDAVFPRETASDACDPKMNDLLRKHADVAGIGDNFVEHRVPITDDHAPFLETGITAVDLIDAGRAHTFPPYWHTTADTMDKVSPHMLGAVGSTLLGVMQDPALVQPWVIGCGR